MDDLYENRKQMMRQTYTHIEHETQEPASTLVTLGFLVGTPLASGVIIITVTYLIKWIGGLL